MKRLALLPICFALVSTPVFAGGPQMNPDVVESAASSSSSGAGAMVMVMTMIVLIAALSGGNSSMYSH